MSKKITISSIYALLAAIFYAINMPASKILLKYVEPTLMASFLYFGAGIGIGIIFLFSKGKNKDKDKERLCKSDFPYVIGMILLDILAPILLMIGLSNTTSGNAALLNNFEIVATSLIALMIFKEVISEKMWIAISLIIVSSAILSIEDMSSLEFSAGSLLVILAAISWGFENNCTKKLSLKNNYQIVMIKGIFSGLGSFIISLILKENLPEVKYFFIALALGFVAYGLSISLYIKAQRYLGAAKTSAYYAIAPFVGAFLSFILLDDPLYFNYIIALVIMIIASVIIAFESLAKDNLDKEKENTLEQSITSSPNSSSNTEKDDNIKQ